MAEKETRLKRDRREKHKSRFVRECVRVRFSLSRSLSCIVVRVRVRYDAAVRRLACDMWGYVTRSLIYYATSVCDVFTLHCSLQSACVCVWGADVYSRMRCMSNFAISSVSIYCMLLFQSLLLLFGSTFCWLASKLIAKA